jgi:uncharacterized repeat protein (TIGR02543 family)
MITFSRKGVSFLSFLILFLSLCVLPVFSQDTQRGLSVLASPIAGSEPVGLQYAVLIAVDRYKEWPPLKNAVSDAEQVRSVLQQRYYFDTIHTLYNEQATKEQVMKLFEDLSNQLRPEDSLLVFYAGHGVMDPLSKIGSWVLQDGSQNRYEQKGWLPNPVIRNLLDQLRSKHVLLISDSCFSGDILNMERGSQVEITDEYFKKAYARRSRQVLTSGASESVPDESLFTRALVRLLEENTKPFLDPLMLFNEIRLTRDLQTSPLLGNLKDTGSQEGGSYIFFLKQPQPAPVRVLYEAGAATKGAVPVDSGLYMPNASAKILAPTGLSREGYEFAGWNTRSDGSGKAYQPGEQISLSDADVHLYAQWKQLAALNSGWIDVSGIPPGAEMYLDSVKVSDISSAKMVPVTQGSHTVSLRYSLPSAPSTLFNEIIEVRPGMSQIPSKSLRSLAQYLMEQKNAAEQYQSKSKSRTTRLVIAAAGFGAAGICYLVGQKIYQDYKASTDVAQVSSYRTQLDLLGGATVGALAIGAVFTIQIPFVKVPPKPQTGSLSLNEHIQTLDAALVQIQRNLEEK